MPEQEPRDWNAAAAQETLDTTVYVTHDVAYGDGELAAVGPTSVLVEVFPATGVTRVTMPGARIELFRQQPPRLGDGGAVLTDDQPEDRLSLAVRPSGKVVFSYRPKAGEAPTAPDAPLDAEVAAGTSDAMPAPVGALIGEALPPGRESGKETHERVEMTGKLGRTPKFHRSGKGTLVGRFPIAIPGEGGQTTWRRVLIFGARAERLREQAQSREIIQGTEVDLVAYVHEKEVRGSKATRIVQEFYAVVVKPVQQK